MKLKSPEQVGAELSQLISGDVLFDIYNRLAFSSDASIYQVMPLCIAAVRGIDDVMQVIRYGLQNDIPIVARGAGSGVAGESLGTGIVINFSRYMKRIIGVEHDGEVVVCEPGVVLDELNDYLSKLGRMIGPDPSSGNRAVMGGIVANNATGAHSLEYGYIGDHIERIETVLYDGSVVEFTNNYDPAADEGSTASEIAMGCMSLLQGKEQLIKNAMPATQRNRSGYNIAGICKDGRIDMARLLVGSEGTLGVFTKMAIRTVELPGAKAVVQIEFDSFENAGKAVPVVVETGASACEMMDRTLLDMAKQALPQYSDIFAGDCEVSLLVEHVGRSMQEVADKISVTENAVANLCSGLRREFDPQQQKRLWKSRKDAVPLLNRQPGPSQAVAFIEDVSVDHRRLCEYMQGLEQIGRKYDIPMAFYGHAGDGELHIRPFLDLSDPEQVTRMVNIANDVFELAWSLGGSISGEHADGLVRAAFIRRQYGDEYYQLLKGIKDVFDTKGVFNPGKIINEDPEVMTKNLRPGSGVMPERLKTKLNFTPEEFRTEIERCNGDGACLADGPGRMCPVFRAGAEELDSSRGKANMLRAWISGRLSDKEKNSAEFREIVGMCINCKMCSVECPSGVDISRLLMEARAEIAEKQGLSRTEKTLSMNRFLAMLSGAFSPVSNWVSSLGVSRWFIEKFTGLDRRRKLPAFERGSFVKKAQKWLAEKGPLEYAQDSVVYFVDSYAGFNDHSLGWAVLKVLRKNNVEVVVPDQRPAPVPAMVYGDVGTASRDLEYSIKSIAPWVRKGYKVICSEPTAALCLKDEARLFVKGEDVDLIAANTYELMSYLWELRCEGTLKDAKTADPRRYAYHCPCHIKAQGVEAASSKLLANVCRAKLTDVRGGCCGLAGTFGMQKKKYAISMKIGEKLAEAIKNRPEQIVLTECGACKMQIEHMTGKKVMHPVKILAEHYN